MKIIHPFKETNNFKTKLKSKKLSIHPKETNKQKTNKTKQTNIFLQIYS